jgi:hypothetical protein
MSFVISFLMALVSFILGSFAITRLINTAINIGQNLPSIDAGIVPFLIETGVNYIIPIVAFLIAIVIMTRLSKAWLGLVVLLIMFVGVFSILFQFGFI